MFPHELAHSGAPADLSVDLGIDVVLLGLPPVYAHGLQVSLTAAGLRCTIEPATAQLPRPPAPGSTVVAVLPSEASPTVGSDDGRRLAEVHVLAEPSVQAYAAALHAGATGAFAHDAELGDIVRIVLCAGLRWTLLPVDVAQALNRSSVGPRPELTGLDLQYLQLLADGATVAGLARRFTHSEREMYRLLSATYQRLGAQNRTEALLLAQRLGVLDERT